MDPNTLKQQLHERFEQALNQMIQAVDQAPDGRWIADSEWTVRQAGQDLTRDCYQALLQDRIDRTPAADQPPFSPSPPPPLQGQPKRRRPERRR